METLNIVLTKPDLFAAAARFVSTESTRYYLRGVYIEPREEGGVCLVATNGHYLFAGVDAEATANRAAIITPPKVKMGKEWWRADGALRLDGAKGILSAPADCGGGIEAMAPMPEIDSTFPDWRRVIPTGERDDTLGGTAFDIDLLATFGDVHKKLTGSRKAYPGLAANSDGVAFVTFGERADAFGVLMGIRDGAKPLTRPDWI